MPAGFAIVRPSAQMHSDDAALHVRHARPCALLYIAHGIDSTGSGIVGERSGHERGVNAMRHHNSVFNQLLKHLPWDDLVRLAGAHRADALGRRLEVKSDVILLSSDLILVQVRSR